jgi:hypothetical protein
VGIANAPGFIFDADEMLASLVADNSTFKMIAARSERSARRGSGTPPMGTPLRVLTDQLRVPRTRGNHREAVTRRTATHATGD